MTKKKSTKEKVVSEFDSVPLAELETQAKTLAVSSMDYQFKMYEILVYIKDGKRWMENPLYKRSSFWQYLDDIFTIREQTYRENVLAMQKHPEFAKQYGVGLVSKVRRECGALRVSKVHTAIEDESAKRKKPLTRLNIAKIIEKHTDVKKKIKKVINDWKSMYEVECAAHDNTKESLRAALATVCDLEEQIEKLKVTAAIASDIRNMFEVADARLEEAHA